MRVPEILAAIKPYVLGWISAYLNAQPTTGGSREGAVTSLTGDVTGTGPGATPTALAAVLATPGTYGDATHVARVTLDVKGRVTAVSEVALASAGSAQRALLLTLEGDLAVETGTLRFYNRLGADLTLDEVHAAVATAPTGATLIVDLHKNGTTIFTTQSNRPAIADGANEATAAGIDVTSLAEGEYLTLDIDQVGSTVAGSDLTVSVVAH